MQFQRRTAHRDVGPAATHREAKEHERLVAFGRRIALPHAAVLGAASERASKSPNSYSRSRDFSRVEDEATFTRRGRRELRPPSHACAGTSNAASESALALELSRRIDRKVSPRHPRLPAPFGRERDAVIGQHDFYSLMEVRFALAVPDEVDAYRSRHAGWIPCLRPSPRSDSEPGRHSNVLTSPSFPSTMSA